MTKWTGTNQIVKDSMDSTMCICMCTLLRRFRACCFCINTQTTQKQSSNARNAFIMSPMFCRSWFGKFVYLCDVFCCKMFSRRFSMHTHKWDTIGILGRYTQFVNVFLSCLFVVNTYNIIFFRSRSFATLFFISLFPFLPRNLTHMCKWDTIFYNAQCSR